MESARRGGIWISPKREDSAQRGVSSGPLSGDGGFGGAAIYLRLKIAGAAHVAQERGFASLLSGQSRETVLQADSKRSSPKGRAQVEAAIKHKVREVFHGGRHKESPARVHCFDLPGLSKDWPLTVASLGILNTL